MPKKKPRHSAALNKKLAAENAILEKRIVLTERSLNNSLTGLADGLLMGAGINQSPLTSFLPMAENNIYASVTLQYQLLMFMYRTHGLLQTAIDVPVLDALRGGLDLHSDQLDSDDLGELEDKLEEDGVLERITDAFIWARLFGGAALIINSEEDSEEPLGDEVLDGQIEIFDCSRWELSCDRRIPESGMYGFYGKNVHESRVITIVGKRAPWLIRAQLGDWGESEVARMVEDFNLYIRNRNVIYELLEEAKVDVYKLKGFAGQLASSSGTNLTVKRIQTMNAIKNFNSALIMDSEDEYTTKQTTFTGLGEMMKENRMAISSALRMPMSKIFGIPSSGLSSSGEDDIENYNALVESEVRQPMKKIIRKVLQLYVKNMFGDDLDINFKFKPLRVLSAVDEETVKRSKSDRYIQMFDKMLANSKEMGDIFQKENLVPIPLEAEKGLLDDHPTTPEQDAAADAAKQKVVPGVKGAGAGGAKGGAATKQPPPEKKLKATPVKKVNSLTAYLEREDK